MSTGGAGDAGLARGHCRQGPPAGERAVGLRKAPGSGLTSDLGQGLSGESPAQASSTWDVSMQKAGTGFEGVLTTLVQGHAQTKCR